MKRSLFIFELANNHSGEVEHGINTIKAFAEVANKYNFDFAFKFQYRDLDTLIHPEYKDRMDIKYIKRFSETKLSEEQFLELKQAVVETGFKTICTPFDEASVDKIVNHGYEVIKIASCSFTDWPLLEKVALAGKPVIASTAGASLEDIDHVVSFFTNRGVKLTIMHCIGEYPTARKNLQLNQLSLLTQRYPMVTVGFSTHEDPNNVDSIKMAIAKGAKVFERHIALNTPEHPINAYSSTPEQIDKWLQAATEAMEMCGVEDERQPITEKEYADLRGLKRGVFAKRDIYSGETITSENTYFAIPCAEGQVVANDLSKYNEITVLSDIKANQQIAFDNVSIRSIRDQVSQITTKVRTILDASGLALPKRYEMELSHHYGIENFEDYGAAILSIINREYCKKLIVLLPGQKHPNHYHVKKEETFHVLYGEMNVELNGETMHLVAGDLATVERNMQHSFSSETGCIFEEISTTHYLNDSFYEDKRIVHNKKRKTIMPFMFENISERDNK